MRLGLWLGYWFELPAGLVLAAALSSLFYVWQGHVFLLRAASIGSFTAGFLMYLVMFVTSMNVVPMVAPYLWVLALFLALLSLILEPFSLWVLIPPALVPICFWIFISLWQDLM